MLYPKCAPESDGETVIVEVARGATPVTELFRGARKVGFHVQPETFDRIEIGALVHPTSPVWKCVTANHEIAD